MRGRFLSVFALAVLMSGRYHVTVVTSLPEAPTPIEKPFQMSFVAGLVPPSVIQAEEEGCTQGVAKVETWHSFVNFLIGSVSSNLVTPISVSMTCAASP